MGMEGEGEGGGGRGRGREREKEHHLVRPSAHIYVTVLKVCECMRVREKCHEVTSGCTTYARLQRIHSRPSAIDST